MIGILARVVRVARLVDVDVDACALTDGFV